MQLISIARRIKIFQTAAGLKRQRSAYSNISFSDEASLLRLSSYLHHNHHTSVFCNNDIRRYSHHINVRSMPLASNNYYQRENGVIPWTRGRRNKVFFSPTMPLRIAMQMFKKQKL